MAVTTLVRWRSLQIPGNTEGLYYYTSVLIRIGAAAMPPPLLLPWPWQWIQLLLLHLGKCRV